MIDPATIVALMRAEGHTVTLIEPGEIFEDVDGIPAWVAPPTITAATMAAPILSAGEWQNVARHLLGELEKKESTNDE